MKQLLCVAGAALALGCGSDQPAGVTPRPAARLTAGEHHVAVDGIEIAVHVAGSGPVCLVWPGAWALEWTYLRMPELEKHLTVVYVEPAGTGRSGRFTDPARYSLTHDAEMIEGLRRGLGLDKLWLLGHSSGGFVALRYALAHADHLAGLVLYDSLPMWNQEVAAESEKQIKALFSAQPWYADAIAGHVAVDSQTTSAGIMRELARSLGLYFYDYASHKAEYDAHFADVGFWIEAAGGRATEPYDVRAQLPSLSVPTLILVGARDAVCPVRYARDMDAAIPSSTLIVLERSGHLGHIEQPRELAQAIDRFVRGDRRD